MVGRFKLEEEEEDQNKTYPVIYSENPRHRYSDCTVGKNVLSGKLISQFNAHLPLHRHKKIKTRKYYLKHTVLFVSLHLPLLHVFPYLKQIPSLPKVGTNAMVFPAALGVCFSFPRTRY